MRRGLPGPITYSDDHASGMTPARNSEDPAPARGSAGGEAKAVSHGPVARLRRPTRRTGAAGLAGAGAPAWDLQGPGRAVTGS